jgi:hypothetical protein
MKYTQNEAIEFECAREVITNLISIYMGQIYEESSKPNPDAEFLSKLNSYHLRLVKERKSFHVKDHVRIPVEADHDSGGMPTGNPI